MKLTAKEVQAIQDMRAMDAESALAWRQMGGMLSGRLKESDAGHEDEDVFEREYVSVQLLAELWTEPAVWIYM
jgi:hypothetical protein